MVFPAYSFYYGTMHGAFCMERRKLKNSNKQWNTDTVGAKKGGRGTEKAKDGPEVDRAETEAVRCRRKNSQAVVCDNASFISWLHSLEKMVPEVTKALEEKSSS